MAVNNQNDLRFDEPTSESENPMITIFPDEDSSDSHDEKYVLKAVSNRRNLNVEDKPESTAPIETENTPKRAFSFPAKIAFCFMFLTAIQLNFFSSSYKGFQDTPSQFTDIAKGYTIATTCAGLIFVLFYLIFGYSRIRHHDDKNNEPFATKAGYIFSIFSALLSFISIIISLVKFCISSVYFHPLYLLNVAAWALSSFAFFKAVKDSNPTNRTIFASVLGFALPIFYVALYIYSWITAAV